MPTTSTYALRYPASTDTADVPRDVQNLAVDVEAAINAKGHGVELDYAQTTTTQTTTATTQAAATAIVTGAAVTYDGATAVMVEFVATAGAWHSVAGTQVLIELYDGSTDVCIFARGGQSAATIYGPAIRGSRRMVPSAGAHTFSIRLWGLAAGTSSVGAGTGTGGTDNPMYLRVTRA